MVPVQFIILLLVIRLPAMLEGSTSNPAHGVLPLPHGYGRIIASLLLSQAVLVLYVMLRARTTIRRLHQTATSAGSIAGSFDRILPLARWGTILFTASHLFLPHNEGIPAITTALLSRTAFLKSIPLLPECLYIAPAILAWLAFWTAQYHVDEAYREHSLPYRLAAQLPAHEMPSLPSYLTMHMRHNFYLLIPILLVTLIECAVDYISPHFPYPTLLGGIAVVAAILVLLLMTPWLITRLWATTPLTGPLRQRLDELAGQYRLRFRNILIWKTHNAITNAAILGYTPRSRYFLMSDALLESLTDQQIESVFAHEVGHGRHWHLWWYGAALLSAVFLTEWAEELLSRQLPTWVVEYAGSSANAGLLLSFLLLGAFLAALFPYIAHRFEHQADYFAATHMNARGPSNEPPPVTAESLSGSYPGTELFISSLDALVEMTHRSRNKKGWMHPSINHRIEFLREMAVSAEARKRFARRMLTTRLMIVLLALAAMGVTVYSGWNAVRESEPSREAPAATQEKMVRGERGRQEMWNENGLPSMPALPTHLAICRPAKA